jgi:hypothetical protein
MPIFPVHRGGVGIFCCPLSAYQKVGNMSDQSYTVDEFCEAERISRAHLYNEWKRGRGPRYYLVGNVRRISHQARIEWQRKREAETMQSVAVA